MSPARAFLAGVLLGGLVVGLFQAAEVKRLEIQNRDLLDSYQECRGMQGE